MFFLAFVAVGKLWGSLLAFVCIIDPFFSIAAYKLHIATGTGYFIKGPKANHFVIQAYKPKRHANRTYKKKLNTSQE